MAAHLDLLRHGTYVIAALLASTLALASPTSAASAISFRLYIGGSCLTGFAPPNAHVDYTWSSSSGTVKTSGVVESDAEGYWYTCPADEGQNGASRVEIGDRLKVAAAGAHRTYTVPPVTLVIDRVAHRFTGSAPAGSTVSLSYYPGYGDTGEGPFDVPVRSDGTWRFDPGDINWPQVTAWLNVKDRHDFLTVDDTHTPRLVVTVNTGQFSGYAGHWQGVSVALLDDATGHERGSGTATADYYGRFAGVIRDAAGRRLRPQPGDRVVARDVAPDAEFVLQRVTATADPATEFVSGRCVPNDTFAFTALAWVWRANGRLSGTPHDGETNARGRFAIDTSTGDGFFSSPSNIKHGSRVKLDCLQTTGDAVRYTFVVP